MDGRTDGRKDGRNGRRDGRTDDAKTISLRLRRGIKMQDAQVTKSLHLGYELILGRNVMNLKRPQSTDMRR